MDYKHKVLSDSVDKTEIEATVPFKELEPFREAVYKELAKDVKIQGFRPGKAPRHLIEPKIASELLNESVGRLIQTVAFKIFGDENYKPIVQPEYNLESLDPEKGILFKFTFTNYPKVELGDFSKIDIKKEQIEISDDEVDTVIKSIIRSNVKPERIRELTKVTEVESKAKKKSDKKDSKEEKNKKAPKEDKGNFDFELNDALIEELGYEKERTLNKVREQVREQLTQMKEQQNADDYVNQMVEKAVEASEFEIPQMMVDNEVKISKRSFEQRLEEINLDADTYLATQGKSKEDLEKEWKKQAEQRVSIDLVLTSIVMEHDAMPTDKEVDEEIDNLGTEEEKKRYRTPNGRDYVRMVLARRRGLSLLQEAVEGKTSKKKSAKKKDSKKKESKKASKETKKKEDKKAKKETEK